MAPMLRRWRCAWRKHICVRSAATTVWAIGSFNKKFTLFPWRTNMSPVGSTMNLLENRLREAYDELWDTFVDPREPFFNDGERWLTLGGGGSDAQSLGPINEAQLADIRRQC